MMRCSLVGSAYVEFDETLTNQETIDIKTQRIKWSNEEFDQGLDRKAGHRLAALFTKSSSKTLSEERIHNS